MFVSNSGITLRYQVKPSVLEIHKQYGRENAMLERQPLVNRERMSSTDLNLNESEGLRSQCSYLRPGGCRSTISYSRLTFQPSVVSKTWSPSTISLKSSETSFFCDWFPQLFGVDEDLIPSEEEEFGGEELLPEDDTETKETEAVRKPRYGRRARQKPILQRKDGEKFECICDIDTTFERHYVPHFGGGVKSEKEDWKVPHFASYWEDREEDKLEDGSLLKLIDRRADDAGQTEKRKPYQRSRAKFYGRNLKQSRREILDSLRPLTCRELRRYRMPFSEAVILELEEDGFVETSAFLKDLLIEEFKLDQTREPCPTIREGKSKLEKLVRLLVAVERKGRKQEFNTQSVLLLKIGKYFSEGKPTWWWLAERLYSRAVEVSSKYLIDGGKSEAIARYIYGMFLLDYERKVQAAQEQLTRARELSLGRDWNAGRVLNIPQEPIHKECCNYLCRALIETSKQLRKEGKQEDALQFIHQSYKLCEENRSCRAEIELETLFELGMTYQSMGEIEWAKSAFKKYVAKAKMEGYGRSICDGHLELAICFQIEGELNHCQYHLKCYLEYATANGDENLQAFGNRFLGEFLLDHGHSKEAVAYFEKAFQSFLEQCQKTQDKPFTEWLPEEFTLPQDVELARVLTGLAKGEILTKPICRLILRARDVRNEVDTLKLLKWKNSQEITFDIEEDDGSKESVLLFEPETEIEASAGKLSSDSFLMDEFQTMENEETGA